MSVTEYSQEAMNRKRRKSWHWSALAEWGSLWGMRCLLKLQLLFGRKALQWLLYPVVSYYWLVNASGRRASQTYLAHLAAFAPHLVLGNTITFSYRHFMAFANAIADKISVWSGSLSLDDVQFQGRTELFNALETGKGVLLLGSHLGNLEICRVLAQFDREIRINVLMHTRHAQKFNRLLQETNPDSQLNIIQVDSINAATAMLLSDKVAQGELVIIAADRSPVSQQPRMCQVNFLGAPAFFPQGPFILAALLQCPVFTIFCLPQQNNHMVYFEAFSEGLIFPKDRREQLIQQSAQRYAHCLESYCVKAPLQWFNFYDFWD